MVPGYLYEKNNKYYMVLDLRDEHGKRKMKWISTGLPVKGNKRRAENMLQETRRNYENPEQVPDDDMLFSELLLKWLAIMKPKLAVTTYASYENSVHKIIVPYFKKARIKLSKLTSMQLDEFYTEQSQRVTQSTVLHYHAIIHKALKYACKNKLIISNPADDAERPHPQKFEANFYNSEEITELFQIVKGTKLEIPVLLAAFYGLRRSEVVGLKWSAIDFSQNTISIKHTVTTCYIGGKRVTTAIDRTKNLSSNRTLPLVPEVKERLLALKEEQKEMHRVCKRSYCKDYLDYICVDQLGNLINPDYITEAFPKLLEKNGLRRIRFHDLRHSCASLLLDNNVPMKEIQEWLGHSDFSTTANIYSHLEYKAKISSANAMAEGLSSALNNLK